MDGIGRERESEERVSYFVTNPIHSIHCIKWEWRLTLTVHSYQISLSLVSQPEDKSDDGERDIRRGRDREVETGINAER